MRLEVFTCKYCKQPFFTSTSFIAVESSCLLSASGFYLRLAELLYLADLPTCRFSFDLAAPTGRDESVSFMPINFMLLQCIKGCVLLISPKQYFGANISCYVS